MTKTSKKLIFDIETDGLYDEATKCWLICIKDPDTGEEEAYYDTELGDNTTRAGGITDALTRLGRANQIIGHNIIGYDLPVLRKLFGWVPGDSIQVTDTLILSRLFLPDRDGGHSLRAWGERLGFPKGDYDDWEGGLTEAMVTYCHQDVRVTEALYGALKASIKGQRWGESIELEHQVAKVIAEQECNGVLFDLQLANKTLATLQTRVDKIDEAIEPMLPISCGPTGTVITPYTATGKLSARAARALGDKDVKILGPFRKVEYSSVDLNSIHQVKKWLTSIGWQPTEYTPTGGGKLTEDSFDSLEDSTLGEMLRDRVQCKHRMGQIQGWVDELPKRGDGRISASANTIGTPTGRFRHRTVVNVPAASLYPKNHEKEGQLHYMEDTSIPQSPLCGAEMRSMFKAADGFKIVGHDASGLELRMLAHYMNDDEYTEILLNGDIHSHNQKLADLHTRASAKTFI